MEKLPEDYINRMKNSMGEDEYISFLASYESEPHRSLRINRLKKCSAATGTPDFVEMFSLEPVSWCENGFYYGEDSQPGKHPLHEAGAYYIQEACAMAPVQMMDFKPGMRVLDLCAAPGGKSTEIAELLNNTGLLVANEPNKTRAKTLSLNIERMGISNTLVTNETPDRLSELFPGFFDRILVDAPCSGEGMFRKNPEAVSEWSLENVLKCASRQDEILKEAAKMLCPGGIMVYSTCTFSEEENEGSIERFLSKEKDFRLISSERLMPHKVRGEGHFYSVLCKNGTFSEDSVRISLNGSVTKAAAASAMLFNEFESNTMSPSFSLTGGTMHEFGEQLYLAPSGMPGIKGLKVLRPGLHLGTLKNKRFEPSHALALFLSPDDCRLIAGLPDDESALRYLKGESLSADILSDKNGRGWCIVSLMGMSLGWGKSDGRMIKNHYPKGLRLNI